MTKEEWKNRHRISAKLLERQYSALMRFCRENDYSVNTALRVILDLHFLISDDD